MHSMEDDGEERGIATGETGRERESVCVSDMIEREDPRTEADGVA